MPYIILHRFPLIGSVVQMGLLDAKYPHRALATLAEKYGGLMSIGFGVHYTGAEQLF